MALLAAGHQDEAEKLIIDRLRAASANHLLPDVEDVFFFAACTRSRFDVDRSAPLFRYVAKADSSGPHGQASRLVVSLDRKPADAEAQFQALDRLSGDHPDDSLVLWMVAVQCRALNKNDVGIERYRKLCETWKPGPVLIHQTFANLLDKVGRYEEALVHREQAVKMEPAPWAYDGLGNTLANLRRWDASDAAFAEATRLDPDDPHSWLNWAKAKRERGDNEAADRLTEKANALK